MWEGPRARTFHVGSTSIRLFAAHYKAQRRKKNTDDIIATFQLSTSLGHVYSFLASPIHLSCYILWSKTHHVTPLLKTSTHHSPEGKAQTSCCSSCRTWSHLSLCHHLHFLPLLWVTHSSQIETLAILQRYIFFCFRVFAYSVLSVTLFISPPVSVNFFLHNKSPKLQQVLCTSQGSSSKRRQDPMCRVLFKSLPMSCLLLTPLIKDMAKSTLKRWKNKFYFMGAAVQLQ